VKPALFSAGFIYIDLAMMAGVRPSARSARGSGSGVSCWGTTSAGRRSAKCSPCR
jgi:hypothetical protein